MVKFHLNDLENLKNIIKENKNFEEKGYATIPTKNLIEQLKEKGGNDCNIKNKEDLNLAKEELIKKGELFFRNIKFPAEVNLDNGEIKERVSQRLYLAKEKFILDGKELETKNLEKDRDTFIKMAEKFEKFKTMSNETIAVFTLIEMNKDRRAFSDLSKNDMAKISGLDKEQIKNSLNELKENKIIYSAEIPLKEPYKYKTKDNNGNEIEKEKTTKEVFLTDTKILSKLIKQLEELKIEKPEKSNTAWNSKANEGIGMAD